MKKKVISLILAATMVATMATGCGSSSDSKSDKKDAKGKVYYLNFKPEQDEQWQDLAKEYTKETGVDVTVLTAASGEYEKTLKSEMAKSNAPTLFQVNGPVGLASWKDYCYDLKDSDVAKQLTSDDFALMDGDKMSGIAYVIESYGIIYNKELLKKAEEVLAAIPQVNILGHPKQRAGCISIQIDGVHPYDFASMIDKYGVAVRTGSMCAQPIVNKMGLDTVIRISPAFYNMMEEMEKLGEYTEKVIAFFERIKR